ncbi:hypothetical protein RHGRI_010569 [Rhododendron griersonianum]|uniref:Translation initiation factor IF2/IF5 domain-containing protein n=1 Tax=Rhododendron griersonianum TaxID=479676 RepID=A0AAV6KJ03_9ERIC|nr:hypothetical protein RHGRI_010569 [Rhododendron griersonianum]
MHRQPDYVMIFLLAEMGTSGSLDGQQRLVIQGRFAPKNFEGILRRYITILVNSFLKISFRITSYAMAVKVQIQSFPVSTKESSLLFSDVRK